MAEYNQLMNQHLFAAASTLPNEILLEDRGAFFKSIMATMSHIMVGDIFWLKRFALQLTSYTSLKLLEQIEKPTSLEVILFNDMATFTQERAKLDQLIIDFCHELTERDIDASLVYSNYKQETHRKKLGSLILHIFFHQTHHRGQITTLLSQLNIEFGETDLPEIVSELD
ncbi:MAG: hypothetical protein ISEC1_P0462 [Thiomicrorhabdus sp.]|nr:MAG: hypothetical protein ISEC1_P0462 [Thiomicrorhabdus sp.]